MHIDPAEPRPRRSRSSSGRHRLPPPHAITRSTPTPTLATIRSKVIPWPSSAPSPTEPATGTPELLPNPLSV
jgi:hypothetical protein